METSPFVEGILSHGLLIGTVFVLVLCGMGLPVPEEIVFLTVGFVGAQQGLNIWLICAAGLVGILLGDSIPFFLGRRYGMGLLTRPFFARLISPASIDRTRNFFQEHGSKTIFAARFVAGLRMPAFFMAGAMGVVYPRFIFWDLLGAMISCPTSVWLAYTFGPLAMKYLRRGKLILAVLLGLIVVATVISIRRHARKAAAKTAPPAPEIKKEEAET